MTLLERQQCSYQNPEECDPEECGPFAFYWINTGRLPATITCPGKASVPGVFTEVQPRPMPKLPGYGIVNGNTVCFFLDYFLRSFTSLFADPTNHEPVSLVLLNVLSILNPLHIFSNSASSSFPHSAALLAKLNSTRCKLGMVSPCET